MAEPMKLEMTVPGANPASKFNPNGQGYDYERAISSGMGPAASGPNAGHWGSVAPVTTEEMATHGLPEGSSIMLKGSLHPTWDKAIAAENARGSNIQKRGDRYFSVPQPSNKQLYELLDSLKSEQNSNLTVSIDNAVKSNSDVAAEDQKLSSEIGLPPDVVARNREKIHQDLRASRIKEIADNGMNPALKKLFADPEFAKIAHPDADGLSVVEQSARAIKAVGSGAVGSLLGGGIKGTGTIINDLAYFQTGDKNLKLGSPIYEVGQSIEDFSKKYLRPSGNLNKIEQVAEGVGQAGGQVALWLLSPAAKVTSLSLMLGQGATAMEEMIKNDPVSRTASEVDKAAQRLTGAAITAVTNTLATKFFISAPQTLALSNKWLHHSITVGLGAGVEGITELAENVLHDMAGAMTNPESKIKWAEAQDAGEIGAYVGAIVQSIANAALHIKANKQKSEFEKLQTAGGEQGLKQKSPDAYSKFSDSVAAHMANTTDGPITDVYIDRNTFKQALTDNKIDPVAVGKAIPSIGAQVDSVDVGGDIVIPMNDWIGKVVGTDIGAMLSPHARGSVDAPSLSEVQQATAMQPEMSEQILAAIAKKQTSDAFVKSSHEVQDIMFQQLKQTGRYADPVSRINAQFVRDFVVTQAANQNMMPMDFFNKYMYKVAAEGESTFNQDSVMGINVKNDIKAGVRYADDIVDGKKMYETRDTDSLRAYVGSRVAIVRTGEGAAKAIGEVTLGEPLVVNEEQFNAMRDKHLVPAGSTFDIKPGGVKYLYPVTDATRFESEKDVGKGIVSRRVFNQPSTLARGDVTQPLVERGERALDEQTRVSETERVAIDKAAKEADVSAIEIERQIRKHKKAHPVSDGWAPLEFIGVSLNDNGGYALKYKSIAYQFDEDSSGEVLKPGTPEYAARTEALAKAMHDEVLLVYERALAGDENAASIIRQAGWYKEMRSRLRKEFGGLGDLFADLLGATSPNTPVRTNWESAVDLLRRASRGDFDEIMPKWVEWSNAIDEAETEFAAWFNGQVASGRSKADITDEVGLAAFKIQQKKNGLTAKQIKELPEYQRLYDELTQTEYHQKYAEVAALRELPDDLVLRKESGPKYGFNGRNAIRAMLDLWRVVRDPNADIGIGGTAPKALNFSGNLIGFREKATIDVWAARLLQRLSGRVRIPSMAESSVSGKMLSTGETTQAFGFGQEVFKKAVKEIRIDPIMSKNDLLSKINDDDLQAIVWFLEKEVWTKGNWTSAAGEGGSFEYEADLTGQPEQARIRELRKIADSGAFATEKQKAKAQIDMDSLKVKRSVFREQRELAKKDKNKRGINAAVRNIKKLDKAILRQKNILDAPSPEVVKQRRRKALDELKLLTRTVDRFMGGLSIQQSTKNQGVDFVPSDSDMAVLGEDIRTSVYESDNGATVLGSKVLSTQGYYGSPERSLDLEVIARAGFNPNPMWLKMLKAAQKKGQDSTFLSRVLRDKEEVYFDRHRPGVEIYFREAGAIDALQPILKKLANQGIEFYTVIVDGKRSPEAMAGAMPPALGVRFQFVPEMRERYGLDDFKWSELTTEEVAVKIEEAGKSLRKLADQVTSQVEGVSFAGQFWYETEVAFKNQYQEKIDAITRRSAEERDQGTRGARWSGESISEGVKNAANWVREARAQTERDGSVPSGGQPGTEAQAGARETGNGSGKYSSGGLTPLEGGPVRGEDTSPDIKLVRVAEQYAADNGIDLKRQSEYAQVDPARATRIADAYAEMKHDPQNPVVAEAYQNMIKQTRAQYQALVDAGYEFYFYDNTNDPYDGNPWNAMRDLRANQRMGVYSTEAGFGSGGTAGTVDQNVSNNPLLEDTGLVWMFNGKPRKVLANDLFRAVHDAFGHGLEGAGFRAAGEENAWQAHVRLFTGSAVAALTSETRGQNSWTNFGPYGEHNRTAKVEDTIFADQKTGLLPEFALTEGRVGDQRIAPEVRPTKLLRQPVQGQEDARGGFDPTTLTTILGTEADNSTFLHETAHFFLSVYADMAANPNATEQSKQDMQTILDWFGVKDLATWNQMSLDEQRKYHEQFAYNYEIYLFEGKAPNIKLQTIFDRFSAWLARVYKSIRDDLNAIYRQEHGTDLPILTGEVRQVMDRMLATSEQIKQTETVRNMVPIFQTQEQSGMDDSEWAAYQEMSQEATNAAIGEMQTASLRQMKWLSGARSRVLKEMQKETAEIRKSLRDKIVEEVKADPVYRAINWLKTGETVDQNGNDIKVDAGYKLSIAAVKAMYPESDTALYQGPDLKILGMGKQRGMMSEDGLHPDLVAEMFGFKSGDDLVRALVSARKFNDEVNVRTDERMLAEHAELQDPKSIEVAVESAIHNEARARFVSVELRHLAKATAPVRVMLEAARQAAVAILASKPIGTIKPKNYAIAEARAAQEAIDAYTRKSTPEQSAQSQYTRVYNKAIKDGMSEEAAVSSAKIKSEEARVSAQNRADEYKAKYNGASPEQVAIEAKRNQLLNNQLAAEAIKANRTVAKSLDLFKKVFTADSRIADKRDMNLVSAARAILANYGMGKTELPAGAYLAKVQEYDPEFYAEIEPMITAHLQQAKPITELTTDQFTDLSEQIQALWHLSRRNKQMEIDGKMVDRNLIVAELVGRIGVIDTKKERRGYDKAMSDWDKRKIMLMGARAAMRRVESWVDAMDGGKLDGPFRKYIWNPISEAVAEYRIAKNEYLQKYLDIVKSVEKGLAAGSIAAGEIGYTFKNKAELLHAILHTGNESNKRKLLLGRGWAEENQDGSLNTARWDKFMSRMYAENKLSKVDFDFAQSVWDLLEEMKPAAQKVHKDMYGFYFNEISANPVITPFGIYRGGYVPAVTDPWINTDAAMRNEQETGQTDNSYMFPTTGRGFTKGRVEYNKPLMLDLGYFPSHLDKVLRFIHIEPKIKDVAKIVKTSKTFSAAMDQLDPTIRGDMLVPWLQRTAMQMIKTPMKGAGGKLADKFFSEVRTRTGMQMMVGNVTNALQQLTGLSIGALKVKPGNLRNALWLYTRQPTDTSAMVTEKSKYMNTRMSNQQFEISKTIEELLLNPSKYDKLRSFAGKHGYFMQQGLQNVVDTIVWVGAYNQSMTETGNERDAVRAADSAVRLTQGSFSPEDVSRFETGTAFVRAFTMFYSYFNMQANLLGTEFTKTVKEFGVKKGMGQLLYIYTFAFMIPAVLSEIIVQGAGGFADGDDDEWDENDAMALFFGSQARTAIAMIPIVGPSIMAGVNAWNSKPYDDRISTSASISALESTVRAPNTLYKAIAEDGSWKKAIRDTLTALGMITGLPLGQMGKPIGYAADIAQGKVNPESAMDVTRGVISGKDVNRPNQ